MRGGRYVVLGLAHPRADWFRDVTQWANSSALPIEFLKCLSPEELRARLGSGRAHSAILVDAGLPSVDRDLIAFASDVACPVFVIDDPRAVRDWKSLGASDVLPAALTRAALLDALSSHARLVSRVDQFPAHDTDTSPLAPWRGVVIAAVGSGGVGTSTVAISAAQALASDVRFGGSVVLVDLCRNAELAMLHDTAAVAPGIQELVEAHRAGRPGGDELRRLTFHVAERGYDLVLGLRRARFWPSLRPAAFAAAFTSLTRGWQAVVADTDADFESEDDGGSVDVEERNLMSRTAVAEADVVLAVGRASMKGLHSLTRVLGELVDQRVAPERIVPVLNEAPRTPRQRALFASALADLTSDRGRDCPSPIFLPRRNIDTAHRDGVRLPDAVVGPLARAMQRTLDRHRDTVVVEAEDRFVRVTPGSLGAWHDDGAADSGAAG